jgi:hypothetical protein
MVKHQPRSLVDGHGRLSRDRGRGHDVPHPCRGPSCRARVGAGYSPVGAGYSPVSAGYSPVGAGYFRHVSHEMRGRRPHRWPPSDRDEKRPCLGRALLDTSRGSRPPAYRDEPSGQYPTPARRDGWPPERRGASRPCVDLQARAQPCWQDPERHRTKDDEGRDDLPAGAPRPSRYLHLHEGDKHESGHDRRIELPRRSTLPRTSMMTSSVAD